MGGMSMNKLHSQHQQRPSRFKIWAFQKILDAYFPQKKGFNQAHIPVGKT